MEQWLGSGASRTFQGEVPKHGLTGTCSVNREAYCGRTGEGTRNTARGEQYPNIAPHLSTDSPHRHRLEGELHWPANSIT